MPATSRTITKVIPAPWTTRERMSRPSSPVPMRCTEEGGLRRLESMPSTGEKGASQGASAAVSSRAMMIASPTMASGFRARARARR